MLWKDCPPKKHLRPYVSHIKAKIKKAEKEKDEKGENPPKPAQAKVKVEKKSTK